jgi:sugar phosphate isomerase/epimerase
LPRIGPIGLQLYTVRTLMEKDMPGTLQQVAAIGYREVEFAGYFGRTPAEVRALLARTGLTAPSTHIPIEQLRTNWQRALDDANEIGHRWVTIPWLAPEQRPTTVAGWRALAAELNRGAEQAHASGLRFAYHNHDFEIHPIADTMPLEILMGETDPTRVDFEMDVYWVTKAGADPVSLMARHPGRFKLLHLKDATPAPQRDFADVGHGTIDWPAVLAQRGVAGTEHIFVERDVSPDPLASIRASYEYLASLKPSA